MLWGARHAGASFAGILELVTEHADFFFIFLLESHVRLLHCVYLFSDQLHFADLSRNLVFKAFGLSKLSLELGSNLVQELVQTC